MNTDFNQLLFAVTKMNESTPEHTRVTRNVAPENQRLPITADVFGIHYPLAIEAVSEYLRARSRRSKPRCLH
ncbi:MAG: hypothetical protein ACR2P1_21250 [Pseudomonadales bacterium]